MGRGRRLRSGTIDATAHGRVEDHGGQVASAAGSVTTRSIAVLGGRFLPGVGAWLMTMESAVGL